MGFVMRVGCSCMLLFMGVDEQPGGGMNKCLDILSSLHVLWSCPTCLYSTGKLFDIFPHRILQITVVICLLNIIILIFYILILLMLFLLFLLYICNICCTPVYSLMLFLSFLGVLYTVQIAQTFEAIGN